MLYTRQSFTLPSTNNKKLSDLEYEIRVGVRCVGCHEKVEDCVCNDADDRQLGI